MSRVQPRMLADPIFAVNGARGGSPADRRDQSTGDSSLLTANCVLQTRRQAHRSTDQFSD